MHKMSWLAIAAALLTSGGLIGSEARAAVPGAARAALAISCLPAGLVSSDTRRIWHGERLGEGQEIVGGFGHFLVHHKARCIVYKCVGIANDSAHFGDGHLAAADLLGECGGGEC